jgi:hypothetical protein
MPYRLGVTPKNCRRMLTLEFMRGTTAMTTKKRKRLRALPAANAFAYTIEDGQAMGLPGKTSIYKMISNGQLEVRDVGGRRMLTGDSVRRVLGIKDDTAARST